MARQPLGAAKKDKIVSTRITKREEEVLSRRYGSPARAFRGFVNSVMQVEENEYLEKLKGTSR